MVGLNAVPEPLWWLLGAIVAFYFGARETHYFRNRTGGVAVWLLPGRCPRRMRRWRSGGGVNLPPILDL
jgi:hypothetical protein